MTVPNQTDSTPEELLRSLGAERRLLALEVRAERNGYGVMLAPPLTVYHGDGAGLRYRYEAGKHGTRWLTREEALALLLKEASDGRA